MSDDTPTVEKPAEGAQPAPAGKPSALPEAEITRLTDEIVTALKTVSALGPEPDVGRGARRPQHVVSYLFGPKPPH